MIRTEDDVRAAFLGLADEAPTHVGDRPDYELAPVDVPRPRGRFAVAALAAAAVVAVVAAAAFVADRTHRTPTGGPPPQTASSLDFDSTWDFGPTSFPGFDLSLSFLTPDSGQQYSYAGADNGSERSWAYVRTFATDSAINDELAALTPTTIGDTDGYSGVLDAGTDELHRAVGATPNPSGKEIPDIPEAYVFWPIGADRWAALRATQVKDEPSSETVRAPVSALIPIAAAAQVEIDANVAFVKIAYLPQDARFANVSQAVTLGSGSTRLPEAGPDGLADRADRSINFVRRGTDTPVLSVSAALDPTFPLTDGSDGQLPDVGNGPHGPWDTTTVRGHLAFVSDNAVVIQWDDVEITLTDVSQIDTVGQPMYSRAELIKVAESLTVSPSAEFGQGYPLVDSLPASAFGS